ncbi:MAG: N-6 DNA methylase, partial [Selenomonadaceae bacterium]|nr:N-6 DNA methylase [Selenomonadaceae bacterium]
DDGHFFIGGAENEDELDESYQTTLNFGEWEDFLYARMVEHVGNRRYWEQWAEDIADIAKRHTDRINDLISVEGEQRREFYNFVYNLQQNLNPNVTPAEAVDLLAQHIVTRPVFNAIFENYSFANINPVSQSLEKILNVFDTHDNDDESEQLQKFFDSVRKRCAVAKTAEDKQTIIIELYEKFFSTALKKTAEKLGIVYTPVEVVDFILRSVDAVLKKYFNRGLSDKNIHVLDPFAGTGTFLVRLIQSGLIRPEDLSRKYRNELHANEIVLLAYYIAAVNIENAFYEVNRLLGQEVNSNDTTNNLITYLPFNGICFTDTFELYERGQGDLPINGVMKENSARVNLQKQTRIEVIIGNPPYSVGQKSANDNNQNQTYLKLEDRIAATYAAATSATNKNSLYDSYIKAFRWASDRISDGGVIGFVTNAGWIDGAAMDGLRKCFAKDFSAIYVFNLRGNQRTQGEDSKREGGKIFGSGSRAPIAITILVKTPDFDGKAEIFYRDIGDYLTRERKLDIINRTPDVFDETFAPIIPNDKGDWINQRGNTFETFIPLHEIQNSLYRIFFLT